MNGRVHGGQQPVDGSTLQLYTIGSSGNGSAATPMLIHPVQSDAQGNFNISADYACGQSAGGTVIGSPSNQVYIVATGGNPGLRPAVNNGALVMVAALGDCANLPSATFVEINEVTTVAAAWALAPFMRSATNVGATATNVSGVENAFLDAALLADTTTGLAATLPANLSIETNKLYALADAVASCVNTDGGTGCNALFTAAKPSGGTKPTDTLGAVLKIVKNPGQNVAAVYNAMGSTPPFATGLTRAPNDWTMSLTITGGGLAMPTALGLDQQSDVWVAGQGGPLSAFGPQGAPLSAAGFGKGSMAQSFGLAIDSVGDIWVTDYNGPHGGARGGVTEFAGSNANSPGTVLGTYSNQIYYPYAVSADTNGKVFLSSDGTSNVTIYNSDGTLYASGVGSGNPNDHPQAIAVDANDGYWLPSSGSSVGHVAADGSQISTTNCCEDAYGVATDAFGNAWITDYLGGPDFNGAVAEVSGNAITAQTPNLLLLSDMTGGGVDGPAMLSIDAAQNVWVPNFQGNSLTELAGNEGALAAGTPISPSTGVYGKPGYGQDANLDQPYGVVPDRAGNLWVSSAFSVVMFFGLATPTVTPVQPVPTAP